MSAPAALTFDLYGTLVDFSVERDETPLVEDLLAWEGVQAEAKPVLSTWVEASLRERGKTPFRTVRESLVVGAEHVARVHGFQADPVAWARSLEGLWSRVDFVEGAVSCLQRLDAEGIPWAVVTNLDAHVLEQVLGRSELSMLDPVAVCSEHARAYKPHPRPFRMALDRLGVPAREALHVGDSPSEDRAGARAAGLRCRLVDSDRQNLKALLDELLGESV